MKGDRACSHCVFTRPQLVKSAKQLSTSLFYLHFASLATRRHHKTHNHSLESAEKKETNSHQVLTMNIKDGERSGYSTPASLPSQPSVPSSLSTNSKTASPDMPPTPATSHRLRRTLSQETLATTISDVSSTPSLIYPNAPLNTPATQSIAGDSPMSTAADFEIVTDRLQRSSSPLSPSSGGPDNDLLSRAGSTEGDIDIDLDVELDDDPFKEGKAHLRAQLREDAKLGRQLFKSPERKRTLPKYEMLRKYGARTDRSITPTRLSFVTAAAANTTADTATAATTAPKPGVLEFTTWGPVAEEDTERALKRMAMLARDEHQKNPQFTVEEYYSMRLAKLIEEAEISFDATHLH